jgi:hypothetical protein
MIEAYTISYWLDKNNDNNWEFVVIRSDDSILVNTILTDDHSYNKISIINGEITIVGEATIFGIDDIRVYAINLSDDDIRDLYSNRIKIDDTNKLYCSKIIEPINLLSYSYTASINLNDKIDDIWCVSFLPSQISQETLIASFKPDKQYIFFIKIKSVSPLNKNGLRISYTDTSTEDIIPQTNNWEEIKLTSSKPINKVMVINNDESLLYISHGSYITEEIEGNFNVNKGIVTNCMIEEETVPNVKLFDYGKLKSTAFNEI